MVQYLSRHATPNSRSRWRLMSSWMRSLSSKVLSTSTRKTIDLGNVMIDSESPSRWLLKKLLFAGRSKRAQRQGARRSMSGGVLCLYVDAKSVECNEAYESFSAACQCFVHNFLRFAHNCVQVRFVLEALRVDLVDVFRARGSGRA